MADSATTQPDDLTRGGAASVDEARLFREIVGRFTHLPEGVRRVDFRFGEHSVGAPAVWITLVASDDLKPSKPKIANVQRLANDVQAEVLRSGSGRWPYVEIATE